MKHMIQPFGIDMHKNVLTDTKAVKHMHFYEADKTNTILNISFIPSSTTEWIICYNDNNDISEFICIGCQNIFTTLSLKEFDHYFGTTLAATLIKAVILRLIPSTLQTIYSVMSQPLNRMRCS
jgi:hypothetical protein